MTEVAVEPPATDPRPGRTGRTAVRVLLLLMVAGFAAFWTWALFFASKEAVNRIDDRAWAERAQQVCAAANAERNELADYRPITEGDPDLIAERADIVDRATDIIEQMLDDVVAVPPTDDKGIDVVPLWEADYRTYVADRRHFAQELRASGDNLAFYETAVDGIPISEKIETFAGDNDMPDCAPPRDLSG